MQLEILTEKPAVAQHRAPLLFVHGMWHGAWCWKHSFLPYFAQHGFTACAVSLRGHGGSEGRDRLRWTSLAEYVDDVKEVATSFDNPPVLIGHSMGGIIVQKYLSRHPASGAVLLASVPPRGLWRATLRFLRRHFLVFLRANLTFSLYPVVGNPALCKEMLFSADTPTEHVVDFSHRLQDESYRAYWDMLVQVFRYVPQPALANIPVLVLGAAKDGSISRREVEETARAYGTEAELIPEIGHDMMLDMNWQSAADRIFQWLLDRGL